MDAHAEFQLPRRVQRYGRGARRGASDHSKRAGVGKAQRRIREAHVVEHVGELEQEGGAKTLAEEQILGDGRVHVPAWQAAKNSVASGICVKAREQWPELCCDGSGISKQVNSGAFRSVASRAKAI